MNTITTIIPKSHFLNNRTAIEAKLSDHNVVIRGRTLFFNMMMQGRWNTNKHRYNNGFAVIESDEIYQKRIINVVRMLAEILTMNTHIMFIGLAEAPIKPGDIAYMRNEAKKHSSLSSFLPSFIESNFTPMGIATFINHDYFHVTNLRQYCNDTQLSLVDRVQKFELTAKDGSEHFELVNLHLPYDIAKSKDHTKLLHFARWLFAYHQSTPLLLMGDFNIYPEKIAKMLVNVVFYIQTNNNLLARSDESGHVYSREYDTVDAVIQSDRLIEKARLYLDTQSCPNAGVSFYQEHAFFGTSMRASAKKITADSNPPDSYNSSLLATTGSSSAESSSAELGSAELGSAELGSAIGCGCICM